MEDICEVALYSIDLPGAASDSFKDSKWRVYSNSFTIHMDLMNKLITTADASS